MKTRWLEVVHKARLPGLWRLMNRRNIVILTYHGFTRRTSFDGIENHQGMHLHQDVFHEQLTFLKRRYEIVSLSDAVSYCFSGHPRIEHGVVVTMDDGYRSCYTLAFPVLRELRVPAAFFVSTDFVFERKPLWHDRIEFALNRSKAVRIEWRGDAPEAFRISTKNEKLDAAKKLYRLLKNIDQSKRWTFIADVEEQTGVALTSEQFSDLNEPVEPDELKEMAGSGLVSIGSHTKTHAILSRCVPDAALREEVRSARDSIEQHVGGPCDLFCYPNGGPSDFDARTREALLGAQFKCALTTIPGVNGRGSDPMTFKRLSAPRDAREFAMTVSGLRPQMARAYQVVRGLAYGAQGARATRRSTAFPG